MAREEAITEIFKKYNVPTSNPFFFEILKALEQEPLTDKEQRIFLAAIGREEKICREVDEKYPDREPYEDNLVSVCRSIERKVKKALWE